MSRDELAQEARNYYGLLPELGEKVGYIRYFEDIFFLLRKREALLKTPPRFLDKFGDQDAEMCLIARASTAKASSGSPRGLWRR